MAAEELRKVRGGGIAMVFQDPMTSLNPVMRIARQLVETMLVHGHYTERQALERADHLLGRMGITAPERAIDSYPHQFRAACASASCWRWAFPTSPALLCDEPTTALDVTIQAQILELLVELNRDFNTAIVLISHNLGVIASVCSRVLVMYGGEVVEEGPTEKILADPRHPYTWALINAVPRIDRHVPGQRRLVSIEGTPPDPLNQPKGCRFAARCPFRIAKCDEHPELLEIAPGRKTRCWVTQAGDRRRSDARQPAAAKAKPGGTTSRHRHQARRAHARIAQGREAFPTGTYDLLRPKRVVHAVDGVDLDVRSGETVGLVGESAAASRLSPAWSRASTSRPRAR